MDLNIRRVSKSPVHTAEHLLNATMVKMFGCPRSRNVHIERKKSKCDYDACVCIGAHVQNTSEIGDFRILSHDFNEGVWRVRWKVTIHEQ